VTVYALGMAMLIFWVSSFAEAILSHHEFALITSLQSYKLEFTLLLEKLNQASSSSVTLCTTERLGS